MKMIRIQGLLLFTLALSLFFVSCKRNIVTGTGDITTASRQAGSFDKIVIKLPVDAVINVGNSNSVSVKTYENLHEYIKTDIADNTLTIYSDEGIILEDDITFTIGTSSLKMLKIAGAADAEINGNVAADRFDLKVSGASSVDISQLNTEYFLAKLSGASKLTIESGKVGTAEYRVSGAAKIYAFGLMADNAKAKLSGAGKAEVNVSEKLEAKISGAGYIDYKGHPTVSSKISGAGSVNDVN